MPKKGEIELNTDPEQFINPKNDIEPKLETVKKQYIGDLNIMANIIKKEIKNGALSYSAFNIGGEIPLREKGQKILNDIRDAIDSFNDILENIMNKANEHLKYEVETFVELCNKKIEEEEAKKQSVYDLVNSNWDAYKNEYTLESEYISAKSQALENTYNPAVEKIEKYTAKIEAAEKNLNNMGEYKRANNKAE